MPVDTMVSAISRTVLSSTFSANLFQLFHPMGGVDARSAAKQMGARESTTTMNRCIAIECIASAEGAHVIWRRPLEWNVVTLRTLDDLRRFAVAHSLFPPTTLKRALRKLGFVQADPIRAPARAQDLTLRHRVVDYRAGDLERRYDRLGIEEDFFVNYGFLPRRHHALMHPRTPRDAWSAARGKTVRTLLNFVHARGDVHP